MTILPQLRLALGSLVCAFLMGAESVTSQVVFIDAEGRELSAADLQAVSGTVSWEIRRDYEIPVEAGRLHQQAREAGSAGEMSEALRLLAAASELAPEWPYPEYDAAFTYLLMEDFPSALEHYRRTLQLSPRGFFTAMTAVRYLEEEAAGTIPTGVYLFYTQLEWIKDPATKERAVRSILDAAPGFAPAWKELALLTEDVEDREAAIETGLASQPDPETLGVLLINKAIGLFNRGEREAAVAILGTLALDPDASLGSAQQAKAALAILLQQSG